MEKYLLVLAGAALGGLARYLTTAAILAKFPGKFPMGTVLVNISGCFLIGVVMTLLTERWLAHDNWRLLLVVGVLGGYTTFSSFAWETFQTVRDGNFSVGFLNVAVSVIFGYLAVWCGALLVRK